MKKRLTIILLVILIFGVAGFYFYKTVLPQIVADAVVKGKYSVLIPQKVEDKIESVRDTINHKIETVIVMAQSESITIQQLMDGIDQINKNEFKTTFELVNQHSSTRPSEIFDIANDNIEIEAFDPTLLKPAFVENVGEKDIEKALGLVERNGMLMMDMYLLRNIAKQVLFEKQEEIIKRVDVIKQ